MTNFKNITLLTMSLIASVIGFMGCSNASDKYSGRHFVQTPSGESAYVDVHHVGGDDKQMVLRANYPGGRSVNLYFDGDNKQISSRESSSVESSWKREQPIGCNLTNPFEVRARQKQVNQELDGLLSSIKID
jgi:hypothetical protein